jgi:hypothetical protein
MTWCLVKHKGNLTFTMIYAQETFTVNGMLEFQPLVEFDI